MGAHTRDRSILFVLDGGRGRWEGRGRHMDVVWCKRGCHGETGVVVKMKETKRQIKFTCSIIEISNWRRTVMDYCSEWRCMRAR
jgi:hypothetical protein